MHKRYQIINPPGTWSPRDSQPCRKNSLKKYGDWSLCTWRSSTCSKSSVIGRASKADSPSLQDSLVSVLTEFQQHQRTQKKILDVHIWVKCHTLYVVVMPKKVEGMNSKMVVHLHTVMKLYQKASTSIMRLEYDT